MRRSMLYQRWREVAAGLSGERALVDLGAGRSWTFSQLAAEAERLEVPAGRIVYPRGDGATFVLEVLRGWRQGAVVCPLEDGQAEAAFGRLPGAVAHVKTTSATTRVARSVAFTATQLAADATNIVATMGLRRDWPNLGAISLAHSYGFSNLVLPLLLHGIPLVLVGSRLPEAVRRAGEALPGLTLPAVPSLWRAWHDANAVPTGTRLAISAGAPLPLPLEQEVFRQRHLKIHNFYGATECGGIAYDGTEVPRTEASVVGCAMSGVQLSTNAEGCLRVEGANVASGYWPEADANLGSGHFQTSDQVELGLDGMVRFLGRNSEVINVAGRKVVPEEVERVLQEHPGVRQCVVLGVPRRGAEHGERIVAVIVAEDGVRRETLESFLSSRVPDWQRPGDWWFVEDLMPSARGKVIRSDWRRRFLETTDRGG
ncbi:MAG: acyl--CoA ligase [Verrucomicrobiales bacterium]|nr:acyl--CoA ligase [Verrucomicrobiales bacterium]